MENRKEKAMSFFRDGYNCSQAVVMAFSDLLPYSEEELARMACSFGGGVGQMREVCGTVTGMALTAGLLDGFAKPADHNEKIAHYKRIQTLGNEFREANGSVVCRELLAMQKTTDGSVKKRPCVELCGLAVEILEQHLSDFGAGQA